jgi:hypothetical protein
MSARIEAIRKRRRDRAMLVELRNNPAWGPIVLAEPHKTLRDEFAGQALAGVPMPQGHMHDIAAGYDRIASHCFKMADAMLKAREA